MKNKKSANFEFLDCEFVDEYEFAVQCKIDKETYYVLLDLLSRAACGNNSFSEVEEAVMLRRSLNTAWEKAREKFELFKL